MSDMSPNSDGKNESQGKIYGETQEEREKYRAVASIVKRIQGDGKRGELEASPRKLSAEQMRIHQYIENARAQKKKDEDIFAEVTALFNPEESKFIRNEFPHLREK